MMTLEWLIVMVLAFIVLGPKDFPRLMFLCGDFLRRIRFFGASLYEQMETLTEESLDLPATTPNLSGLGGKTPQTRSSRDRSSRPLSPRIEPPRAQLSKVPLAKMQLPKR